MSDTKTQIVEAAIAAIRGADISQFLAFTTPEDLATTAGVSAGTVRYQFRSGLRADGPETQSLAFDRERLGLEILDRVLKTIRITVEHNAAIYENVASALPNLQDLERVLIAIISDLNSYASEALEPIDQTVQERTILLVLACCDKNPKLASLLLDHQTVNTARHVKVYEAFLKQTSRQMVEHTSSAQLADLITMLLDGAAQRRRYDPDFDMTVVARAVIRIFWSFTVNDGDTEPSYEKELLASFSH